MTTIRKSTVKRWNRRARQWQAELDQLIDQLWPEPEFQPLTVYGESASLWDDLEMFGIVLDDDLAYLESLKGFWVDQDTGFSRSVYWVPRSEELEIEAVSLDHPPTGDDVAWDARPA